MHLIKRDQAGIASSNKSLYSNNLRVFHPIRSETEGAVFPIHFSRPNAILKRTVDVVGSLVGLLILGLALPFIARRIREESPGPTLFKQARTGLDSSVFQCYKIRTMHINDDRSTNGQPVITTVGDPRIFKFGHFLRRTSLDELPQLINVLKGEMSLVGPRPFPVAECQHWEEHIPNWTVRYVVKPGISGWAQVAGYRGGTLDLDHMNQRLLRDFKYIETASFWLDMLIIWKTVAQMIKKKTNAH